MARLFLVEPTTLNVRKAERFGSVRHIFQDDDARSSIWDEQFKSELLANLEFHNFDPQADYLLIAGAQVPITIAVGTMVAEYGPIQVLFFSATERDYVAKIVGDEVPV